VTGENTWSDALWELYGLRREGRTASYEAWRESIDPADRDRLEEVVRAASASGQPFDVEYRVDTHGDAERWLVARGAPVRDASGAVVRYRGVVFDVTALKRATRLADEKQRADALEGAVALLPIGVVLVEMPPAEPPRIVAHNQAYRRIVASAPDHPTPFGELRYAIYREDRTVPVPPPDWPGPRAARTGETVHDQELHLRRDDGSWRVLSVSAAPVGVAVPGRSRFAVAVLLDVTERKEAEAMLRASEARYRSLIDRMPIGVVEADLSGGTVYANPAVETLTGRTAAELHGAGWHDLIHPDDRERALGEWYASVQEGSFLESEFRLLLPGGEVRSVRGTSTGLRDADGRLTGLLGTIRDVTAERKALADLEESRAQLEAALSSMSDAVWISDEAGRFLLFNEAFARIHRFPSKEACFRTLTEYPDVLEVSFPDGTIAPLDRWALPRALRGEVATNQEYLLRRKDTGETWVGSYSFAPIRRGGAIVGGVVVGRDVTEQKRAEESLRESEARFRDVAASAGEYVFEMDTRGVVSYASDAIEKVLGFRPDEVVGRPSFDFMDPEEVPRSGALLAEKVARKERFSRLEQVARHRSGRRVYLEASAVPVLAADGSLLGYRGAAMDVTDRRDAEVERARLQEQLAQSQKMEVVGRLAGGVAHDFNSLLTVILAGGLELLEELRAGRPGEPEHAADIVAAAQRAADLTRQLLAFARRQVVTPEVVGLDGVLREARKLIGRVIGEDVRVVVDLPEGLWKVRGDRGLLDQVVMNLAVNARDAMPRGGTLHLAAANRHLAPGEPLPDPEMAPGDWVELLVRDDGQGMTPEVLAHIFEPFYTTKPTGQGTGLGLATVYGIVKQSGGAITVASEPGKGTEFRVFLPAVPLGGPTEAKPPAVDRGGSESILLVEDEPTVREVTARVLRDGGYRVHVAPGAAEAIAWLEAGGGPIDLLVTDVVMPGMGGSELAAAVEAVRPGTRVLFLSGFTADATLRHGVAADGPDFLAKPFTPEGLRARVRAVLDRA
jgi:PAS domain S-box-containing protein